MNTKIITSHFFFLPFRFLPHYAKNQKNAKNRTSFRGSDEAAEEASKDPDGENAIPGPGAAASSGFGGLGLEGMVGSEDSDGESGSFPGVGKRGVMSGERAGGNGNVRGPPGKTAGAAEMVEN